MRKKIQKIIIGLILMSSMRPAIAEWSPAPEDELKIQASITTPKYNFEIRAPKDISNSAAQFFPHSSSQTGASLSYRKLGLSFSASNPTPKDQNTIYGKTNATDFQLRFLGARSYEFFYQKYRGYYIDNSNNFDPLKIYTKNRIIRSDIESLNTGLNIYWEQNPHQFSQSIAFNQNGHQISNNWGTSYLLSLNNYSIKGDKAFIPSGFENDFGPLGESNKISTFSLSLGGSLGGILTYSNYYMTSLFALGLSSQISKFNFENQEQDSTNTTGAYTSLRFGFGYNGKKHVIGAQALLDSMSTPYKKAEVLTTSALISIFYAYRLDKINIPAANWLSDRI